MICVIDARRKGKVPMPEKKLISTPFPLFGLFAHRAAKRLV
jgi:hypothetical protein